VPDQQIATALEDRMVQAPVKGRYGER
jgi:hypothetical protein